MNKFLLYSSCWGPELVWIHYFIVLWGVALSTYSDRVAKCKDPVFDNRRKDNKIYCVFDTITIGGTCCRMIAEWRSARLGECEWGISFPRSLGGKLGKSSGRNRWWKPLLKRLVNNQFPCMTPYHSLLKRKRQRNLNENRETFSFLIMSNAEQMVPNLIKIRVRHIRLSGNTLGQVRRWTVPLSLGAMMSYYVDHVLLEETSPFSNRGK